VVTSSRAKAILILVGVFLFGAGTGAGFTWAHAERRIARLDEPGPSGRGERHMRGLMRVLDLSPEQEVRVRGIFERAAPERERRMREVMLGQCGHSLREHKAQVDREIRAELTPEQQKRFDELAAEQEKRFFGRGHGPHPD
jgi:Spy/CpxP family protein refolding chaperone